MSNAGQSFGQAGGQLLHLVFSLLFPLTLIATCFAAVILVGAGYPHFALLAGLVFVAHEYSKTHGWVGLVIIALVIGAVPLTRIAYKEMAVRTSNVVGNWVAAGLGGAFLFWLASVWPATPVSIFQQIVFGFLLFGEVGTICEAVIGTLKLHEMNQPRPGPEVVEAQKAHGDAQLASEAEAAALLNSKK